MLTVIVFIIILGLLIFVHELGHFLVAKKNGVRVEEFGFGFPPRLFGAQRVSIQESKPIAFEQQKVELTVESENSFDGQELITKSEIISQKEVDLVTRIKKWRWLWFGNKKGSEPASEKTVYSINLIPLGGFVKIFGEDGQEKENHRSFAAKKIWRRALILAAGVAMNILLAIFLLSLGNIIGSPTVIEDNQNVEGAKVQITVVAPQSPAEQAGIKAGDTFIKMFGSSGQLLDITKVSQVQDFTEKNKGQEISVFLERGKNRIELKLTPRANPPQDEGAMGVGLARVANISYPWYRAIYEGFISTFGLIWLIIKALGILLWQLFSRGKVMGELTGPVGIFQITGQAAQMGFIYLLNLTALLSINLAIINILPFPALDGGRLLFLLIEKIKGSPVSQKIERTIHSAGFVFLIILMVLITVRDVIKLF